MHRDKRLGLALGVLLLGIVGAFFFRNEGPSLLPAAELNDPQKIDEQIAEQDVVPYLSELEQNRTAGSGSSPSDALLGDPWTGKASEFLASNPTNPDLPGASGPPNPISADVTVHGGIPVPRENEAWEPVADHSQNAAGAKSAVRPASSKSSNGYLIHRVEQGDTLSALAGRYLGSSTRYHVIFEANRDVLNSPNDLRLGMSLRIPQSTRSGVPAGRAKVSPISSQRNSLPSAESPDAVNQSSRPATTSDRVNMGPAMSPVESESPARTEPTANRKKLFVPVRRSPLIPGGLGTRTSRGDIPATETPQRLTQQAPVQNGDDVGATSPVLPLPADVFGK